MFIRKGLFLQLNWLKYLGIFPVYKNQNQINFLPKYTKQWYASLVAFNLSTLILLCVIYMISNVLWFGPIGPYEADKTRGIRKLYSTIISGVTQLLSNIILFLRKELNFKILESVVRLENKNIHACNFKKQNIWHDVTFRLFLIFLFLLIIWFTNFLRMVIYSDIQISSFDRKLYVSMISIFKLLYGGLQLTFYTSLVKILSHNLYVINTKIDGFSKLKNNKEILMQLRQLLIDRNEVLRLCENDISSLYGFLLLLDLLSMIVSLVVGFFHTFLLLRNSMKELDSFSWCLILIWITPILFYSVLVFQEDIAKEANKTARILSRISRRGTDIEKMVDKFLLKNIHQRPILTAYGFFPLNKRTLFKIFAAIFTYMVILIQFKDMESTNKRLNGVKTSTTISASTQ